MKLNVEQTHLFADEVRLSCLRQLHLESDKVAMLEAEIADLKRKLDYENRDPLEQIMIEQVLTAHTQNLIAEYQLANLPINTNNSRQQRTLNERVGTTHYRLCRSMTMLTALRLVGPRLAFSERQSAIQHSDTSALPSKQKKVWKDKDIPKENWHTLMPRNINDSHWSDFRDYTTMKQAHQVNEELWELHDIQQKYPELLGDKPPHRFIEIVRRSEHPMSDD